VQDLFSELEMDIDYDFSTDKDTLSEVRFAYDILNGKAIPALDNLEKSLNRALSKIKGK
jgi:hypothetical protein